MYENIISLDLSCSQYEGELKNNLFHGKGKFSFEKDIVYDGDFLMGELIGKGQYTWNSKGNQNQLPTSTLSQNNESTTDNGTSNIRVGNKATYYEGDIKQSFRHGYGIHTTKEGKIYTGQWQRGKRHGVGYQIYSNSVAKSPFPPKLNKNSNQMDDSISSVADGSYPNVSLNNSNNNNNNNNNRIVKYDGEWKSDMRHGYGSMTYPSGNVYSGYWLNNKQNGYGLLHWINNIQNTTINSFSNGTEVYLGTFLNNLPHGYGELIWFNNSISSTPNTLSSYQTPTQTPSLFSPTPISSLSSSPLLKVSANIYRGQIFQGMKHGYGTFFYANSSQYTGLWDKNKKNGPGLFIQTNGEIVYMYFQYDKLISQQSLMLSNTNLSSGGGSGISGGGVGTKGSMVLGLRQTLQQQSGSLTKILSTTNNSNSNNSNNSASTSSLISTNTPPLGDPATTPVPAVVTLSSSSHTSRNQVGSPTLNSRKSMAVTAAAAASAMMGTNGADGIGSSSAVSDTMKKKLSYSSKGVGNGYGSGNNVDMSNDIMQIKLYIDDVLKSYFPNPTMIMNTNKDKYKLNKNDSSGSSGGHHSNTTQVQPHSQSSLNAAATTAAADDDDDDDDDGGKSLNDSSIISMMVGDVADIESVIDSSVDVLTGSHSPTTGAVARRVSIASTTSSSDRGKINQLIVIDTDTTDDIIHHNKAVLHNDNNNDDDDDEGQQDDDDVDDESLKLYLFNQTRDLERLLQKYIQVIRQYYLKSSKQANSLRTSNSDYFYQSYAVSNSNNNSSNNVDSGSISQSAIAAQTSSSSSSFFNQQFKLQIKRTQEIEKQFYGITLFQVLQLLRATGIINGLHFTSYDMNQCRMQMKLNHSNIGRDILKSVLKTSIDTTDITTASSEALNNVNENRNTAMDTIDVTSSSSSSINFLNNFNTLPPPSSSSSSLTTTGTLLSTTTTILPIKPVVITSSSSSMENEFSMEGIHKNRLLLNYFSLFGFPSLIEDVMDKNYAQVFLEASQYQDTIATNLTSIQENSSSIAHNKTSLVTSPSSSAVAGGAPAINYDDIVIRSIESNPCYPILERDCFELIIRCIAQIYTQKFGIIKNNNASSSSSFTNGSFANDVIIVDTSSPSSTTALNIDHPTGVTAATGMSDGSDGRGRIFGQEKDREKGLNAWEKILYNVVFQYFAEKFQPYAEDSITRTDSNKLNELYTMFYSEDIQKQFYSSSSLSSSSLSSSSSSSSIGGMMVEMVWKSLIITSSESMDLNNNNNNNSDSNSCNKNSINSNNSTYNTNGYKSNSSSNNSSNNSSSNQTSYQRRLKRYIRHRSNNTIPSSSSSSSLTVFSLIQYFLAHRGTYIQSNTTIRDVLLVFQSKSPLLLPLPLSPSSVHKMEDSDLSEQQEEETIATLTSISTTTTTSTSATTTVRNSSTILNATSTKIALITPASTKSTTSSATAKAAVITAVSPKAAVAPSSKIMNTNIATAVAPVDENPVVALTVSEESDLSTAHSPSVTRTEEEIELSVLNDTEKWLLNKRIDYDDFLLLLCQLLISPLYLSHISHDYATPMIGLHTTPATSDANTNTDELNNKPSSSSLQDQEDDFIIKKLANDIQSIRLQDDIEQAAAAGGGVGQQGTDMMTCRNSTELLTHRLYRWKRIAHQDILNMNIVI